MKSSKRSKFDWKFGVLTKFYSTPFQRRCMVLENGSDEFWHGVQFSVLISIMNMVWRCGEFREFNCFQLDGCGFQQLFTNFQFSWDWLILLYVSNMIIHENHRKVGKEPVQKSNRKFRFEGTFNIGATDNKSADTVCVCGVGGLALWRMQKIFCGKGKGRGESE